MPMRVEMRSNARRQWTTRGRRLAAQGLQRALEHTLGVANTLVPLDEGPLQNSGKVVMTGLKGVISYDTPYALGRTPA